MTIKIKPIIATIIMASMCLVGVTTSTVTANNSKNLFEWSENIDVYSEDCYGGGYVIWGNECVFAEVITVNPPKNNNFKPSCSQYNDYDIINGRCVYPCSDFGNCESNVLDSVDPIRSNPNYWGDSFDRTWTGLALPQSYNDFGSYSLKNDSSMSAMFYPETQIDYFTKDYGVKFDTTTWGINSEEWLGNSQPYSSSFLLEYPSTDFSTGLSRDWTSAGLFGDQNSFSGNTWDFGQTKSKSTFDDYFIPSIWDL
jgi:hypothetical protein